jgi:hypothetical protein
LTRRPDRCGWPESCCSGTAARERIADRGRKDAAALIRRHDVAGAQHALLEPRALVIGKEKCSVAHQRPADVAAELVLLVGGLRLVGGLGEVVDGVHRVVAVEVVGRAADAIRAGLGADDDGRAG